MGNFGFTGWAKKTTHIERLGDAFELLCAGKRPPDQMILDYFNDDLDSFELQEFCVAHCPLAWSQGIVVIDAALALADEPAEGVGHEPRQI